MKRIENLGDFLDVWRSIVDLGRLDFTVGRRFVSDPDRTMRQYGYELSSEVRDAVLRGVQ